MFVVFNKTIKNLKTERITTLICGFLIRFVGKNCKRKKKTILQFTFFTITSLFFLTIATGQNKESLDTLLLQELEAVSVTTTRLENEDIRSSLAITSIGKFNLQNGQQQLSIHNALSQVPGVFALNADNFAQDLRVSIRGFGARAAFGIRGIKILVDGLPESTPDGQGQVDNLNLGILDRMEVIRGPAAGLYGNAAGGVLSFKTEDAPKHPFIEFRAAAGSYQFQQYQVKTGFQKGRLSGLFHGAYTATDGYRAQSAMQNTLLNGKINFRFNETAALKMLVNYANSPQADDPGGLNMEAVEADRRQARDRNVLFDGGERVEQGRIGLVFDKKWSNGHAIHAKAYSSYRDFANKLPLQPRGIVELQRVFSGAGLDYRFNYKLNNQANYQLKVGLDFESQKDHRERFDNLEGIKGDLSFAQDETFLSTGVFLLQELTFYNGFKINVGTRFDAVRLKADDGFFSNGDDSGDINLESFNPMLGLLYPITEGLNAYANVATSFETPALSELSSHPENVGGFNPNLAPQKANNFELGLKGIFQSKLRYELALFQIHLQDEIVPYELEAFPDVTFYRNAGNSQRNGVELALNYQIHPGLSAAVTYTYSDFFYKDYEAGGNILDENTLPGIPKHAGFAQLQYLSSIGLYASLQARFVGALFADDANTTEDVAYTVANLRLGYQKQLSSCLIEPFVGINNLFNTKYNGNIRINAFGARYFEPAPELNFYAGVKVRFGKR